MPIAYAALLAALLLALGGAPAEGKDRYKRSFNWSGYRWSVRATEKRADPGNNRWGDSRANVRVRADKSLLVDIVGDRSVEVVGPPTSYGRYRWIVRSDLSTVGPFRVVAFFVHGTRGEQDVEFSRWGVPALTTPGSWVTWRRRKRLGFGQFAVPLGAPYTVIIEWMVGATRFRVRDAIGTTLLDTTHVSSSGGRHMAPRISYWRYPGTGAVRSPFTSATAHPHVIVESFRYTRLRTR